MNNIKIEKGILHISANDKYLNTIIAVSESAQRGLIPKKNYYRALLRSIIGQQLSVKAAASINRKFLNYFKNKPDPEKILKTDDTILRNLGLSNAKVKYVKDLSSKILKNEVKLNRLCKKNDEEIIAELTQVKGIGVWTVHMFLIFTLGRLNILPATDLGVRKAIKNIYGLRKLPDEKKVFLISKKNGWSPYNSIASWYLWRSLEMNPLEE